MKNGGMFRGKNEIAQKIKRDMILLGGEKTVCITR
jgi:hypothetical protein